MSIKAEIGLNVSPFLKGAQEVKAATERMQKDVADSAKKHGGEHEGGITFKGHKAEKGIVKLSKDLLNAHSGSEALAAGLERVGKIFGLGLGLGVAAHLAGFLIEKHEKLMEQYEALKQKSDELAESSRAAVEGGDFTKNVDALANEIKLTQELGKVRQKNMGVGGFLGEVFSGAIFTGSGSDARKESRRQEAESKVRQKELIEAGLADLEMQAQIADLKAHGHTEEAAALERERKLKMDLLHISHSALNEEDKHRAKNLVTQASESLGSTEELARVRTEQLATEKELADVQHKENDLIGERQTLGETELEHTARLVAEVGNLVTQYTQLESKQGTMFQHEGDALQIAKARTAAAEKMNELAKLSAAEQKKSNAEEERLAKSRSEALPGIAQNAAALAAAATGNKDTIAEVERRTRFNKRRDSLVKEGFKPEQATAIAASENRLQDLKEAREREDKLKSTVGRADADRALGLGGGAEQGANVHAELQRKGNDIGQASLTELQNLNKMLAAMPPVKLDKTARFAP